MTSDLVRPEEAVVSRYGALEVSRHPEGDVLDSRYWTEERRSEAVVFKLCVCGELPTFE
ncbi:predicted protein [Plenodomus lingam JN3]|uniref:Predicted protein n=1 Tax=Leptosphaeria maculans (strain JN3 / isolate v23.1.3 / race Av1-4-5-6-7-8) TaxID=985895 RepID=E4ZUT5_LEPMJ|nr:predicted protein [Plenodomus lingam JN3]CBX95164.1 predicted protein [Plenodomus lingam JN3]